jgi:hypothetical protein
MKQNDLGKSVDPNSVAQSGAALKVRKKSVDPLSKDKEKEKWTYVQRIQTRAEGVGAELKVMFAQLCL